MRAIDADALQLAIVEEGQANKRKKYIIGDIWELTWAEIRDVINSQPTIQPDNNSENPNGSDVISRQAAIDAAKDWYEGLICGSFRGLEKRLKSLPSAQPERDIPVKPIETTDKAWGIPKRQAVCPKCDYYLGHVAFLGDYKGKRVTYCETCGQAIDWEGWNFDE